MANRYTQFTGQQYVAQNIPLPFDDILKAGYIKQANQDAAQQEVATLDAGVKTIKALPKDQEYAKAQISSLSDQIESYANMDFNDPNTRNQWNKDKAKIAQRFAPTGDLGAIDTNYATALDYKKNLITSAKDTGWGTNQLEGYSNSELSNFSTINPDGSYNQFQGKGIAKFVDPQAAISSGLKDIAADTTSLGLSNKYGTGMDFINAFQTGTMEKKDRQKVINALSYRFHGDESLMSSLEQEGAFRGVEGNSNFIKGSDDQGNIQLDLENPFGQMVYGAATGASYTKIDPHWNFEHDVVGEEKAKDLALHPPIAIAMQVPANMYTNSLDSPEKLNKQKDSAGQSVKSEWVQMMLDNPQQAIKYGAKLNPDGTVDVKSVSGLADIVEKGTGFETWMKWNSSNFGDSANGVNDGIKTYKLINLLDQEATNYANKVAPPSSPQDYKSAILSVTGNKAGTVTTEYDPHERQIYLGDFATWTNSNTTADDRKAIYEKYKAEGESYDDFTSVMSHGALGGNVLGSLNNLKDTQAYKQNDKYEKAKSSYLKSNADTIASENWAQSIEPIMKQDASTGQWIVDEDATAKMNKQVQSYFTNNALSNSIVTSNPVVSGDPNSGYKTIGQIREEEAKAQSDATGKKLSATDIKVSVPFYGQQVAANGQRQMFVQVGSQIVPVDMTKLKVNNPGDSRGWIPLAQLNDNSAARTNTFVSTIYTSGVKNYPIPMPDGTTITVVTPSEKLGNTFTGSFSNNSQLKIEHRDKNGNLIVDPKDPNKPGVETGSTAFNTLMELEQAKLLK